MQTHETNQSTPLKPAEPKDAEQATRDGCWLRNDRTIYLDIIDDGLEIVAIGLATAEFKSQDQ